MPDTPYNPGSTATRCVVSDATPLRYLVVIGEVHLLPLLFRNVTVPAAVLQELSTLQTPSEVRTWVASLPAWVDVEPSSVLPPTLLPKLGLGEREAIALAKNSAESILLTDDFQARVAAESFGIQVVPTLRILSNAAALSLVDFQSAIARLRTTNFRVSQEVIDKIGKQLR